MCDRVNLSFPGSCLGMPVFGALPRLGGTSRASRDCPPLTGETPVPPRLGNFIVSCDRPIMGVYEIDHQSGPKVGCAYVQDRSRRKGILMQS